jgi:hypothetical protein
MQQSADVLAQGMAVAIWNLDREAATQLMDAVMRNPDVSRVTVTNQHQDIFASKQNPEVDTQHLFREERHIRSNGAAISCLLFEYSTARIERVGWNDLFELACALLAQVVISFGLSGACSTDG